MKRALEVLLLVLLAAQSGELLWRRLAWHQSPPELPLWTWGILLLLNFGALTLWGARALRGNKPA